IIMSNLYTINYQKIHGIVNIKYVVINNNIFILIMSQNTLKHLDNKGFYQSIFFLEKALKFI
ncbi:MAG TPA: hypothetical protein V6C58_09825, partial [Allocoleopsis sp.]